MRTGLKKRGALLALLLAFALVVAACGGDDAEDTTTTAGGGEETTTTAPPAGEGVMIGMAYDIGGRGDQSFNDSAASGLDRAVTDLGVETQELEPTAGGENRQENLQILAEAGFELVFGIGFAFAEAMQATATQFPDTTFAIVDSVVEEPNVLSLIFAEEQGSALVGCAAALKTETGTVGFVGGVNVELINKFEAGYNFGVETCGEGNVEVLSTYLTEPPDFSGFGDPAKGKEAALGQYDGGADIVYHAAGGSGQGVFEAAKEVSEATGSKVWGIGVDSDQYNTVGADLQEYVLTSMLKQVGVAVYSTINSYVTGADQSGILLFDLAADGVGYSTSGGFVDDIADQLDALREQIVTGEVVVPTSL